MAQNLQIVATTAALVALLQSNMAAAYGEPVDVQESGKGDFDDQGQLILRKVSVRVRFGDGTYGDVRDITKTTLSASLNYQLICRHESLRGGEQTRSRSLQLIACVQEQLAGARIVLADGTRSEPVLLKSVLPVSDQFGPVEDCYGLGIEISGYSRFSGANANPVGLQALGGVA